MREEREEREKREKREEREKREREREGGREEFTTKLIVLWKTKSQKVSQVSGSHMADIL